MLPNPIAIPIPIPQNIALTLGIVAVKPNCICGIAMVVTVHLEIGCTASAHSTRARSAGASIITRAASVAAKGKVLNEGAEGDKGGAQDGYAKLEDGAKPV